MNATIRISAPHWGHRSGSTSKSPRGWPVALVGAIAHLARGGVVLQPLERHGIARAVPREAGDKVRVHKVTLAADCGRIMHPGIVEAQLGGSVAGALSAPAVANALFALTGVRVRKLPIRLDVARTIGSSGG